MGRGHRVVVSVAVAAPPDRVWRALTVPAEVEEWDGVRALAVPGDYPRPGQHARWRTRLGPWPVTLHDRVREVVAGRRLAADLRVGFAVVEEEYQVVASGTGTVVVSSNVVSSPVPGLGLAALLLVRRAVPRSMARLGAHCAGHR